ncbi:MAG TPA: outer membrane beta-barrel protein, partial [Stellaceae bacterium]|nr:outer membrane beta-barrel protein [Stellaceae bacterium]
SGPLVANPDPMHLDVVPFFGPMYVTGAASGLGLAQTEPVLGLDHRVTMDLSNAQVALQTTEGLFQFFLEPAAYSLPTLGVPYQFSKVGVATNLYGGLPVAWGKLAPSDNFSVQGGKLPTLIGAEYMFTFQNMNIERGLLWNQEPVVSRGVQGNLTTGPVAWSLSLNDGYYSGKYNWLSGAATWTIDPANSLTVTAGGALSRNAVAGPATPLAQNNSTIVEAAYTYNNAPWTITPYVQYTHVGADAVLGFGQDAATIGGAVLASYKFNNYFSLAGRWEYIASNGSAAAGAPDLLGFGPGSAAMSLTLTPTFQNGIFFLRGEASLTQAYSVTAGSALLFGNGSGRTQARFLVETGVVF